MTAFSPNASDNAKQVNFAGDNLAPIVMGPAVTPATRQLPPDIADFTGREKELGALVELIDEHRGPAPVVVGLYGPPGVGKSALALRLAHRLADRYGMQLYLNVGPSLVPREALVHFVRTLTVLDPGDPYPESALRAHYLSTLRAQSCLVLLDDVHSASQARALIPGSPFSTVLITSRAPLSGIEGVHLRPVSVPGEVESIQLLQKASGRTTALDMASARELVAACGRLPLAVRIAGALLKKRPHLGVAGLAAKLRDDRTRLEALADGDLDVRTSLSLSYEALSPTAQQAFRLSALSPNPDVTLADLSALLDAPAAAAADELVDAQLLE